MIPDQACPLLRTKACFDLGLISCTEEDKSTKSPKFQLPSKLSSFHFSLGKWRLKFTLQPITQPHCLLVLRETEFFDFLVLLVHFQPKRSSYDTLLHDQDSTTTADYWINSSYKFHSMRCHKTIAAHPDRWMGGRNTIPEISIQSEKWIFIPSGTSPLKECSQLLVLANLKTLTGPVICLSRPN